MFAICAANAFADGAPLDDAPLAVTVPDGAPPDIGVLGNFQGSCREFALSGSFSYTTCGNGEGEYYRTGLDLGDLIFIKLFERFSLLTALSLKGARITNRGGVLSWDC